MDDRIDSAKVKRTYLDKAVTAALKKEKSEKAETPPKGCAIEYPNAGK